jgi:phospholipid/cholesterol/gamma-HCH transport system substrate-binding protein
MEHGKRDTLLGLVFFGGLGLLIWATAALSNLSLQPRPTLDVYFTGAGGLRVGDPVFVRGVRSGKVAGVAHQPAQPQHPILVQLELDEPVTLHDDVSIQIVGASLLGGKQVEIDPGIATEIHPRDRLLIGENRRSAIDAMGESIAGLDLEGAVGSIRSFFDKLNDPDTSVGALLSSREAYDDVAATLKSLRRSAEAVEQRQGALGQFIHDEQLGADFAAAARDLREIFHKVNEGAGLAARLLNDETLASDVSGAVSDVRSLTERARRGQGLFGKLLADEELGERFERIVANVESVTAKLDDPNAGLIGALLGEEGLLRDARTLFANLSEFSAKINEGKGLLAKLVNDPELGEKVDRMFRQLSRAIEDAREAAPVGTFFQVLAGPF